MPLFDDLVTFCDDTECATAAGTHLKGDVVDLGEEQRDIGRGQALYLNIIVTEAFVGSGASVEFQLASDAAAGIATNGTATKHVSSGAIGVAGLPLGKRLSFAVPPEGNLYERYLGILAVTSGATTTAGHITAYLSPEQLTGIKHYPEAAS